jgi:hypothetical protein
VLLEGERGDVLGLVVLRRLEVGVLEQLLSVRGGRRETAKVSATACELTSSVP